MGIMTKKTYNIFQGITFWWCKIDILNYLPEKKGTHPNGIPI